MGSKTDTSVTSNIDTGNAVTSAKSVLISHPLLSTQSDNRSVQYELESNTRLAQPLLHQSAAIDEPKNSLLPLKQDTIQQHMLPISTPAVAVPSVIASLLLQHSEKKDYGYDDIKQTLLSAVHSKTSKILPASNPIPQSIITSHQSPSKPFIAATNVIQSRIAPYGVPTPVPGTASHLNMRLSTTSSNDCKVSIESNITNQETGCYLSPVKSASSVINCNKTELIEPVYTINFPKEFQYVLEEHNYWSKRPIEIGSSFKSIATESNKSPAKKSVINNRSFVSSSSVGNRNQFEHNNPISNNTNCSIIDTINSVVNACNNVCNNNDKSTNNTRSMKNIIIRKNDNKNNISPNDIQNNNGSNISNQIYQSNFNGNILNNNVGTITYSPPKKPVSTLNYYIPSKKSINTILPVRPPPPPTGVNNNRIVQKLKMLSGNSGIKNLNSNKDVVGRIEDFSSPEAEEKRQQPQEEESITRCICEFQHDDGFMICCDLCSVWQHVDCMEINKSNIPDKYQCELCQPRSINKERAISIQKIKIENKLVVGADTDSDSSDSSPPPVNRRVRKPKRKIGGGSRRSKKRRSATTRRPMGNKNNNNDRSSKSKQQSDGETSSTTTPISDEQKKLLLQERKQMLLRKKEATKNQTIRKQALFMKRTQDKNKDDFESSYNKESMREGLSVDNNKSCAPVHQLRQWIDSYEEAVTNHYSQELRARIGAIKVNGIHSDRLISTLPALSKCRVSMLASGIKILLTTCNLPINQPIIELRGKYMWTGAATFKNHNITGGLPHVFFHRLPNEDIEVCVDCRTYGNDARFVRRSCKPNAAIRHCVEKGVVRLYLISLKQLEKNRELLIGHYSQESAKYCACGSPKDCTANNKAQYAQQQNTTKNNGQANSKSIPELATNLSTSQTNSSSSKPLNNNNNSKISSAELMEEDTDNNRTSRSRSPIVASKKPPSSSTIAQKKPTKPTKSKKKKPAKKRTTNSKRNRSTSHSSRTTGRSRSRSSSTDSHSTSVHSRSNSSSSKSSAAESPPRYIPGNRPKPSNTANVVRRKSATPERKQRKFQPRRKAQPESPQSASPDRREPSPSKSASPTRAKSPPPKSVQSPSMPPITRSELPRSKPNAKGPSNVNSRAQSQVPKNRRSSSAAAESVVSKRDNSVATSGSSTPASKSNAKKSSTPRRRLSSTKDEPLVTTPTITTAAAADTRNSDKMTREEKKILAYMKAFELMEKQQSQRVQLRKGSDSSQTPQKKSRKSDDKKNDSQDESNQTEPATKKFNADFNKKTAVKKETDDKLKNQRSEENPVVFHAPGKPIEKALEKLNETPVVKLESYLDSAPPTPTVDLSDRDTEHEENEIDKPKCSSGSLTPISDNLSRAPSPKIDLDGDCVKEETEFVKPVDVIKLKSNKIEQELELKSDNKITKVAAGLVSQLLFDDQRKEERAPTPSISPLPFDDKQSMSDNHDRISKMKEETTDVEEVRTKKGRSKSRSMKRKKSSSPVDSRSSTPSPTNSDDETPSKNGNKGKTKSKKKSRIYNDVVYVSARTRSASKKKEAETGLQGGSYLSTFQFQKPADESDVDDGDEEQFQSALLTPSKKLADDRFCGITLSTSDDNVLKTSAIGSLIGGDFQFPQTKKELLNVWHMEENKSEDEGSTLLTKKMSAAESNNNSGYAKKRWLRKAIQEDPTTVADYDDSTSSPIAAQSPIQDEPPSSIIVDVAQPAVIQESLLSTIVIGGGVHSAAPTGGDQQKIDDSNGQEGENKSSGEYSGPFKKRRLARESVSSDQSCASPTSSFAIQPSLTSSQMPLDEDEDEGIRVQESNTVGDAVIGGFGSFQNKKEMQAGSSQDEPQCDDHYIPISKDSSTDPNNQDADDDNRLYGVRKANMRYYEAMKLSDLIPNEVSTPAEVDIPTNTATEVGTPETTTASITMTSMAPDPTIVVTTPESIQSSITTTNAPEGLTEVTTVSVQDGVTCSVDDSAAVTMDCEKSTSDMNSAENPSPTNRSPKMYPDINLASGSEEMDVTNAAVHEENGQSQSSKMIDDDQPRKKLSIFEYQRRKAGSSTGYCDEQSEEVNRIVNNCRTLILSMSNDDCSSSSSFTSSSDEEDIRESSAKVIEASLLLESKLAHGVIRNGSLSKILSDSVEEATLATDENNVDDVEKRAAAEPAIPEIEPERENLNERLRREFGLSCVDEERSEQLASAVETPPPQSSLPMPRAGNRRIRSKVSTRRMHEQFVAPPPPPPPTQPPLGSGAAAPVAPSFPVRFRVGRPLTHLTPQPPLPPSTRSHSALQRVPKASTIHPPLPKQQTPYQRLRLPSNPLPSRPQIQQRHLHPSSLQYPQQQQQCQRNLGTSHNVVSCNPPLPREPPPPAQPPKLQTTNFYSFPVPYLRPPPPPPPS